MTSRKATLFQHVARMIDMTIEERCEYCMKTFGYHYSVIHTLIRNETGVVLK